MASDNWALPEIHLERCNRCGACIQECPEGALEMTASGPVFVRSKSCSYCADCETICPEGAISCPFEITWED
jgi:ferredoxin